LHVFPETFSTRSVFDAHRIESPIVNPVLAETSVRDTDGGWRAQAYPDFALRDELTATTFPAGSHAVRPGMRMCWWNGRLGAGALRVGGGIAARVIFALSEGGVPPPAGDDGMPFGSAGWMLFVRGNDCVDSRLPCDKTGFYLSVELGETVLAEIFPTGAAMCAAGILSRANCEGSSTLPLTPAARLALESVRRCPLTGPCRGLILGARCHDLLVEFISAKDSAPARSMPMMSDTESRVRSAAAALGRRLDVTPSLEALAREAGLSETTLKRGFRQVFGSTVFEHLRTLRMERASELLQSGRATVIEAATLVGYSNPSNFASAFRRQFGLNPKEFQVAARR
jgi:AraC-like DNA-binding protein